MKTKLALILLLLLAANTLLAQKKWHFGFQTGNLYLGDKTGDNATGLFIIYQIKEAYGMELTATRNWFNVKRDNAFHMTHYALHALFGTNDLTGLYGFSFFQFNRKEINSHLTGFGVDFGLRTYLLSNKRFKLSLTTLSTYSNKLDRPTLFIGLGLIF